MEITDVKIRYTTNERRMKAVVSIIFDSCFAVHDIKIIEGPEKLFLAMPSKKMPDGTYRDIVHPIDREMRAEIERRVMELYDPDAAAAQPTEEESE